MELASHVRMPPIFPRVINRFSASLYFKPRRKNGDGPFSLPKPSEAKLDHRFFLDQFPLPLPLVYPSQTTRYLQKRQSSLGFLRPNWQFRLSGISGALSFIRRRNSGCHLPSAPLFKVGNTLPTFLLKSPPPPLVRRLTREETASDSPCYPTWCCFAVWSRSRGMKHREILSKNENFSCIDNISLPLHPGEGISFVKQYILLVTNICVWKKFQFPREIGNESFFFFFVIILILLHKINFARLPFYFSSLPFFFMKIA